MNNGVENHPTVPTSEPVLVPVGQPTVPVTTPVGPTIQPNTVPVTPGTSFVAPTTPVIPTTQPVPATVPITAPVTQPVTTPAPVTVPVTQPATTPTIPETNPIMVPETTPPTEPVPVEEEKKKKKKPIFTVICLLIIVVLGTLTYYLYQSSRRTISELKYNCSPLTETKETQSLNVNSTLVQDLYQKVATSIREDVAQTDWNNQMRIYLAYRQIPNYRIYDTNCNYFNPGKMEPYTCDVSLNFVPKGFARATLEEEWKKLYGEETPMPLINIKLENTCVGGFEYVPERDEYVEGYCGQVIASYYKVTKELVEAKASGNMIILKEKVTYSGTEHMELPPHLKSGIYYYTFRLDMNYNYILLSKKYEDKY